MLPYQKCPEKKKKHPQRRSVSKNKRPNKSIQLKTMTYCDSESLRGKHWKTSTEQKRGYQVGSIWLDPGRTGILKLNQSDPEPKLCQDFSSRSPKPRQRPNKLWPSVKTTQTDTRNCWSAAQNKAKSLRVHLRSVSNNMTEWLQETS